MKRRGTLFWIIFLLAAMFLGPSLFTRRQDTLTEKPDQASLRTMVQQERLVDAPANLPADKVQR
ncbi:MAG: hypothetical protein WC728_04870 [Elusimicrobiota bacterium]